jgi:hypothetical protein
MLSGPEGLQGTLQFLADKFDLTSVAGRTAWTHVIGGARGAIVANTLVGKNVDAVKNDFVLLGQAAKDNSTTFDTAVNKMEQTPMFKVKQGLTALKVAAIQIGSIIIPVLVDDVVPALMAVVKWFRNLSPPVLKVIVVAAALVAALGPVLWILGAVFGAVGTVMGAIGAVTTAIGGLTVAATLAALPFIAIGVAVAVLAVVIIKNWAAIKRGTLAVWGWLEKYIGPVISGIITVVKTELKVLLAVWKAAWIVVKSVLQEVWSVIKVLIINRVKDILHFLQPALHFIAGVWKAAWGGMKDVFGAIWRGLIGVAQPVMNALITLINGVIHGINALIHAWNMIPGHGDIPTIATLVALGGATAGSGIKGHAKGGIVTRPTLALVGEAGPEAIIPLNRSRGMGSTVININVAGSVLTDRDLAETVRR